MEFLLHMVVTAGLLLLIGSFLDGVEVEDGKSALVAALVLGIANAVLRPVLLILTFPLTILTLGLFIIVINAVTLMISAGVVRGFTIKGFGVALKASLLLGLFNWIISALF